MGKKYLVLIAALCVVLLSAIPTNAGSLRTPIAATPRLDPSFPVSTAQDEQVGVPLDHPAAMPDAAGPSLRLADLLNADGTLSLPRGVYGSIAPLLRPQLR